MSLWIRRSCWGVEGLEDTNDWWVRLDPYDLSAKIFCADCKKITTVHMPNDRVLEAECEECGKTYRVEAEFEDQPDY